MGWIGGGALESYNYGKNKVKPYNSLTQARLQLSTQGRVFVRATHERLNFLNSAFRVRGNLVFERMINDNYFGLGNDSKLNKELLNDGFYQFQSRSGQARIRARYPFFREQDAQLDLLLQGAGRFYRPVKPQNGQPEGSRLFEEEESQLKAARDFPWVAYLGAGLLWDNRDQEIDTRSGTYGEFSVNAAPAFLSAKDPLISASLDLRGFYNIPAMDSLILAGRLGGEWVGGDVPFWLLPALGGENNLRGYHLRRFRDEAILFHSFIVRKWLLSFDFLNVRVGLQGITEGGRTFGEFSEAGAGLLNNHKRSFGGGLLLSAFTDDFILRFDYVKSKKVSRLYFNLGYVY